jgi:hypothetical protein
MITSELKLPEQRNLEIKFPLLATALFGDRDLEFTVLFTDEETGTVVKVGPKSAYALGYWFDSWDKCSERNEWRIEPPGTQVTLTVS